MEAITLGGAITNMLSGMPVRVTPARSGAVRRTGVPVLRNSIEAGTFEDSFFRIPAKGETDKIMRAARKSLDSARALRRIARQGLRKLTKSERALAALTPGAVRVFEELLDLARLNEGKVYPSYEWLAQATELGRATITRAMAILEDIGFIKRQRRFKRVAGDGAGPRYEQTSNAYRMMLPTHIVGLLPRWMRPAPLPVDAEQHHTDQIGTTAAMLATLSCKEFAKVTIGGSLGKVLARFGAAVDRAERAAQNNPEPLKDSI